MRQNRTCLIFVRRGDASPRRALGAGRFGEGGLSANHRQLPANRADRISARRGSARGDPRAERATQNSGQSRRRLHHDAVASDWTSARLRAEAIPIRITISPASFATRIMVPGSSMLCASSTMYGQTAAELGSATEPPTGVMTPPRLCTMKPNFFTGVCPLLSRILAGGYENGAPLERSLIATRGSLVRYPLHAWGRASRNF